MAKTSVTRRKASPSVPVLSKVAPVFPDAPLGHQLSGVLYRFSCAISSIKVAREYVNSKALNVDICDQAFTVALDAFDKVYEDLDQAIIGISHENQRWRS
jgi:hypothetical protein